MQRIVRSIIFILALAVLSTAFSGVAIADITGKGSQVSIRFPSFSLSPGERLTGMKMTISRGELLVTYRPNRWVCDRFETTTIHCYSVHPSYATSNSGMLPEVFVRNAPDKFSVSGIVEIINNDGKEYTRDFGESELIIK